MRLIETGDGSYTLFDEALDETYHSIHGALGESMYVYIQNGLLLLPPDSKEITILEIGFGTGLNTLLSIEYSTHIKTLHYFALEPYPLTLETLKDYYQHFKVEPKSLRYLEKLIESPHGIARNIIDGFNFTFVEKSLQDLLSNDLRTINGETKLANIIYYDAFAPSKQAELWEEKNLDIAINLMAEQAILVTYCAQGKFKRHLKERGLKIETPPGAFGKREMTIARKIANGE